MTYIEEALNSILISDELFYEEMLEQVNIERDFMLSCFENNIILEADAPSSENKGGWIRKIIETIKNIFNKFLENVTNLFKNDEKWISQNIPKLKNLNFDGLKVNVIPYWEFDDKNLTGVLSNFQKELNNMKYGDARLHNLQDREDVERFGAFKEFTPKNLNDGTFTDGIKNYFKTGKKGISQDPKPVTLEGDQLKIICVNQMSRFVNEFNSTLIPTLKSSYNNFTNILNNAEKEISRKSNVAEGFCIIENDFYHNTELSLCENFVSILEKFVQDGTNSKGQPIWIEVPDDNNTQKQNNDKSKQETSKQNTQETKDEPKLNKVEDTSNDNNKVSDDKKSNNSANSEYYTYIKHVAQLNQIAIAAAITACEERYRAYMSILRGVVSARDKK